MSSGSTVRRSCEPAQVAEDNGDFATMALEEGFVTLRDDQVCHGRREKSLQSSDPLDIFHLESSRCSNSRFHRVSCRLASSSWWNSRAF